MVNFIFLNKFLKTFFLSLICLILFGCAAPFKAYDGEELAEEKLATVSGSVIRDIASGNLNVYISAVDDKQYEGTTFLPGSFQAIQVMPGKHEFFVRVQQDPNAGFQLLGGLSLALAAVVTEMTNSGHEKIVKVNLKANSKYVIQAYKLGEDVHYWVEDEETKEVVGGNESTENVKEQYLNLSH